MKNIKELLTEIGLTIPEDKEKAFTTAFNENYKTIADYDKQQDKLTNAEDKVKTLTESLDKFKGVDPEALNKQIDDLKTELTNKDAEFQQTLAERDFNDLLKRNISNFKGKNVTAITALLDVDTLKKSQNQEKDVQAAIKALTTAEDRAFLFESGNQSKVNPIGRISKGSTPVDYMDQKYKDNPYYKPNE